MQRLVRAFRPQAMRRLGIVCCASALLVSVTACGGLEQGAAGSRPTLPVERGSSVPGGPAQTPPAGASAVPPSQLDSAALPQGYPRMAWTQDEGRMVGLVAQEGGCGKTSAELAEQTAAHVVVVLVESVPAQPTACTMDIRHPVVSVLLDAPLGERTVVLQAVQRKR